MIKRYMVTILFLIGFCFLMLFFYLNSINSMRLNNEYSFFRLENKNILSGDYQSSPADEDNKMEMDGKEDFNRNNPFNFRSPLVIQYWQYSDNALSDLVGGGDVLAMSILSLRLREESVDLLAGGDMESAKKANEKADNLVNLSVLYGDRHMLRFLPGIKKYRSEYMLASSELNSPEIDAVRREAVVNFFSTLEFIRMRGDGSTANLESEIFMERFGEVNISTEDEIEIFERATKIYKQFESKRVELGLGEFDNTMTDYEKIIWEKGQETTDEFLRKSAQSKNRQIY